MSITGGYVYRGKALPDLVGVYVYGDYETGRIWGLRMRDGKLVANKELIENPDLFLQVEKRLEALHLLHRVNIASLKILN